MRRAAILIVCGCNQLLGLTETQTVDAHPPPMCPPVGGVPTLYGALKQVPGRYCGLYTPSADGVVALASRDVTTLMRGELDHELSEIPLVPTPPGTYRILPMPEGDRVLVATALTTQFATIEYIVEADGAAHAGTMFQVVMSAGLSRPSGGPDRRIVYEDTTQRTLVELADTGAGYREVTRYSLSELTNDPVVTVDDPSLSADGLRLVFVAPTSTGLRARVVYYTDRATRSDHFGPIRAVENAPEQIRYPYLTANCGRLYLSALDTIFYLE